MALVHQSKNNFAAKKSRNMRLPGPTLASVESLAIPLVQEIVFLADFRCAKCQERVAEIMAKMNGETDSVVISVLEKKVTLTCRYPTQERVPPRQVAPTFWITSLNKVAPIMRLFLSTRR